MICCAAPLGAKKPRILPEEAPLVRASKPAPAAPSWKQPASFIFLIDWSAVVQPLVPAKVTLFWARLVFQSGSGP